MYKSNVMISTRVYICKIKMKISTIIYMGVAIIMILTNVMYQGKLIMKSILTTYRSNGSNSIM